MNSKLLFDCKSKGILFEKKLVNHPFINYHINPGYNWEAKNKVPFCRSAQTWMSTDSVTHEDTHTSRRDGLRISLNMDCDRARMHLGDCKQAG